MSGGRWWQRGPTSWVAFAKSCTSPPRSVVVQRSAGAGGSGDTGDWGLEVMVARPRERRTMLERVRAAGGELVLLLDKKKEETGDCPSWAEQAGKRRAGKSESRSCSSAAWGGRSHECGGSCSPMPSADPRPCPIFSIEQEAFAARCNPQGLRGTGVVRAPQLHWQGCKPRPQTEL